jgi:hypothetical protein
LSYDYSTDFSFFTEAGNAFVPRLYMFARYFLPVKAPFSKTAFARCSANRNLLHDMPSGRKGRASFA